MTGKEDGGQARFHPLLGGAAVLALLAVTVVAPWFQHHAAVIRLVLRDVVAVGLVLGAYWLIAATIRSAAGAAPVRRPAAPADWFEKYRPDEPAPESGNEALAPVIPLRRPEPVPEPEPEPEVTR